MITEEQLDTVLEEMFKPVPPAVAGIVAVLCNNLFHKLIEMDEKITVKEVHELIAKLGKAEVERRKEINEHLN